MQNKLTTFQFQEVVWAKIIGYPWWPAKIHSVRFTQSTRNIQNIQYRVIFFGDNSQYGTFKIQQFSAYLAPERIAKYDLKFKEYEQKSYSNKKLKLSIEMANAFYQKEKLNQGWEKQQILLQMEQEQEQQNQMIWKQEQRKCEQKIMEQTSQNLSSKEDLKIQQQKSQQNQQQFKIKQYKIKNINKKLKPEKQKPIHRIINPFNVVDLLQNNIIHKLRQEMQDGVEYNLIKIKLKKALLKRYHFNHKEINQKKISSKSKCKLIKMSRKIQHKKHFRIQNLKQKSDLKSLKKLYILKLYRNLKDQGVSFQLAQNISIHLVQKIMELDRHSFKQEFLNAIRWINNTSIQIIIESFENYSDSLLQYKFRFEEETNKTKDTDIITSH